jgi:hypothetical protein
VRLARPVARDQRVGRQQLLDGSAKSARALAVDDPKRCEARDEGVVEMLFENVARFIRRATD